MSAQYITAPLVSIVLPTYKRARVLPKAIDAVIAQTYSNWELIIVDDNSPDETPEIVAKYSDPRIRYVRNDPNLKLPRALNKGFSLSKGDYLTWTSDDNFYSPDAISKMVDRLSRGDCDFVYADYYLFSREDDAGNPLNPSREELPDTIQLNKGNHIGACFLYTRRAYEVVGDYDPELFLVEDYDYFIRLSKHFTFAHLDETLYYFRRDDDTLYLSRFPEVKASDVLVRYKNDLITKPDFIDNLVAIIMRKMDGLKPSILAIISRIIGKNNLFLSIKYRELISWYLRRTITHEASVILTQYSNATITFYEARSRVVTLMQRYGTIQY